MAKNRRNSIRIPVDPPAGPSYIGIVILFCIPELITKIVAGPAGTPDDVVKSACWIDIYGRGLEVAADGDVTADTTYRGESVHYAWKLSKVRVNGDGHVQLDYVSIDGGTTNFIADDNTEVVFTVNGASHTAVYNPS